MSAKLPLWPDQVSEAEPEPETPHQYHSHRKLSMGSGVLNLTQVQYIDKIVQTTLQ